MSKDTNGGEVFDTYGRRIGVVGDRSGAVRLDLGLTDRMLTPELWEALDAKVRASFRPELLGPEVHEDVTLQGACAVLNKVGVPLTMALSRLNSIRIPHGKDTFRGGAGQPDAVVTFDDEAQRYTVTLTY